MESHSSREYHPTREASVTSALAVVSIVLAAGIYVLVARFHFRAQQLIELGCYLTGLIVVVTSGLWYGSSRRRRREEAWPHPPVFVPLIKDENYIAEACAQGAIVAGYDVHGRPWRWSDEARRMQTILIGQSGSGKTTLLHNIASQDIHRSVAGHRVPVIIFDGKGDQEFLSRLLVEISAAGRMHQLRVLDPFRPDISARFNPLYGAGLSHQDLANAFFESFSMRQDFFRTHQAAYLSDVSRVLSCTGQIYNIPDVLIMARDELVMQEQIAQAKHRMETEPGISAERRQNFEMSVRNLLQSLRDRDRVPKIQGLLNELATFTDDNLSLITNTYEDLLTLEEVIDQELILFVSLNANKNTKAVTALGRMILQNLQLIVGERYLNRDPGRRDPQPMVSVILDEFAPFAHPNFAHVLQTARGSNLALLFSVQSVPQLRRVSQSFSDDVSSAPNTIMLLRTRDEETARYFLAASAKVVGQRRTMRVEKRGVFEKRYQEIGLGTVTEIEKTRAVDYQIKNLPVGQMQVLTTDNRLGTLHLHLHVRRPCPCQMSSFEPLIYPRLHAAQRTARGAHLRFRDPELVRHKRRTSAGKKRVGGS